MKKTNGDTFSKQVRQAGLFLLILLLSFTIVQNGQAASEISTYQSHWQELVSYMQSGGRRLRKECADDAHPSVTANTIDQSLQRARSERNACRRVRYYLGVIEQGSRQQRQMARREIIQAYRDGNDSYGAMNAATFYVSLYGRENREDPAVIHEIRTQIFEVAFDNFARNSGYDPFWEKMVLGVHSRQNLENPAFQYYSGARFLRDYPNSSYEGRLLEIMEVASENVQRHMMDPVDQYFRQMDYKAVIIRLRPFWEQRDALVYADALQYTAEAYIKMAVIVWQVGQGVTYNRRCWRRPNVDVNFVTQTIMEENYGTPIDYAEAYQFFLTQADRLIAYMQVTVGADHPATREAMAMRTDPGETFTRDLQRCWF